MLLRLIEWLEVAFKVESVSEVQPPFLSASSISCGEIMDTNVRSPLRPSLLSSENIKID